MMKGFDGLIFNKKRSTYSDCGYCWQPKLSTPSLETEISPKSPYLLSKSVSLFHDGAAGEILVQRPRSATTDPLALCIKTHSFSGSFISLVTDLPPSMPPPVSHNIIIQTQAFSTNQSKAYFRMNQQAGRNVWRTVQSFQLQDQPLSAIFDLSRSPDPKGNFWADIILKPEKYDAFWFRCLSLRAHLRPIF
jgi:hypothetical protein